MFVHIYSAALFPEVKKEEAISPGVDAGHSPIFMTWTPASLHRWFIYSVPSIKTKACVMITWIVENAMYRCLFCSNHSATNQTWWKTKPGIIAHLYSFLLTVTHKHIPSELTVTSSSTNTPDYDLMEITVTETINFHSHSILSMFFKSPYKS